MRCASKLGSEFSRSELPAPRKPKAANIFISLIVQRTLTVTSANATVLWCPAASHTRPAAHDRANTARSHGQDLLGNAPTDQDRRQRPAAKNERSCRCDSDRCQTATNATGSLSSGILPAGSFGVRWCLNSVATHQKTKPGLSQRPADKATAWKFDVNSLVPRAPPALHPTNTIYAYVCV